ncbi:acetyl-CoA carboxylase [Paraburkholderia kururiensis]|uniref:acetyl-CoA carboxylase n=1 Tax=Paraburkholderia kururiensis TaxID=984307 RepID=UPI0005A8B2F4|nr:acetyl-CoA carboxylase [Paraburkholderia kururiensis]
MAQQHEIVSPLPGTFYRRPSPDAAPFVEAGATVESGTVVGLVEVMKQFNDVEAGIAGRVTEILVDDGEPVDAGQVLMRIEE